MKKIICLLMSAITAVSLMAENPTVSSSSVTVQYCQPTTAEVSVTLFPGQSWNGFEFEKSGMFIKTLINSKGCDSILAVHVTLLEGTLPGRFTVAAGQQIYFSAGNLQFNANPAVGEKVHRVVGDSLVQGVWRFAEHQYDIIGSSNSSVSRLYQGWVDLFGYGADGYNGIYPYQTTSVTADYATTTIENTNYDWGKFNTISNGGNTYNTWFTPTQSQMSYILFTRPKASMLHSAAQVNGVHGLVILPDEWILPDSVTFTPQAPNYDVNVYSQSQWTIMEKAGAVFLPGAGYRSNGPIVTYYPQYVQYWLSTWYNSSSAYRLYLDSGSATYTSSSMITSGTNYYGRAVRLVRWVQ